MLISYFEEFPTKRNLSKLRNVDGGNVFVAAKSVQQYEKIKDQCRQYPVNILHWKTLSKSMGYWFSPFMDTAVLRKELLTVNKDTMLDLEFPFHRWHILRYVPSFFVNRTLIAQSIQKHNMYFAVYGHVPLWLLRCLGLMYSGKAIIMCYRSRMPIFGKLWFKHKVRQASKHGLRVGVGLIAPGVHGNERTYSQHQLAWDIAYCRQNGIKEVVVFRLAGM